MGIRLGERLGGTDRGVLWRASRGPGEHRIVRLISQQFSDGQFRRAVADLGRREWPRLAPIAAHDYSGRHYYVEYRVGAECRTLEDLMASAGHWRDRLLMLRQVCEILPQWLESPLRPLGLTMRDIVMVRTAGEWHPWLLPCPPVRLHTPRDLLGLDRHLLSTIAPDAIRGVGQHQRAQDWYALGTLVALAAGCAPGQPAGDDAVTDQARNALLLPEARTSEIPAFLTTSPEVRGLFSTVQRYRFADPGVRPAGIDDLRVAIEAITDVSALAELRRRTSPGEAVELLSWLRPADGRHYLRGRLLAAELSIELGELPRALELLDEVLAILPGHPPAWRLRAEALWQLSEASGPDDADSHQLLATLDRIKGDPELGSEPYRRAAELHRRWKQFDKAADELYLAVEADYSDLEALWLYRDCWLRMGDQANAGEVAAEAHHRVDRLADAGTLSPMEVQRWHEAFDRPLS